MGPPPVSKKQHKSLIPPPLNQNGQFIGYIYGGLPRPSDLIGKEESTTTGSGRGEIRVIKKLHKKAIYYPSDIYILT
jgi:hypothetical protein